MWGRSFINIQVLLIFEANFLLFYILTQYANYYISIYAFVSKKKCLNMLISF